MEFERLKVDNQNVAKCLICEQILKNTAYKRLLGHRKVCRRDHDKPSPYQDDVLTAKTTSNKFDEIRQDHLSSEARRSLINTESEPITSQNLLESNTKPTGDTESLNFECCQNMSQIDEDLAMFFFGCDIPFAVVESEYFLRFVQRLNSKYKPPSRKLLSGPILEKIYKKLTDKEFFAESEKSVLLLDGWKNSSKNEKYVVATIHKASGKRLFLNSWDFTEKSENATNLKEVYDEAKTDAEEKYNADIFALMSDNVSSMICMGKMIDQWHVTCNSHSGNLLAKDIIDSAFTSKVIKVSKEFKPSNLERELCRRGGCRIILSGDTRWCSYRNCYRCVIRNLPFMRDLIIEGNFNNILSVEVIGLVLDENFEKELLSFTLFFDGTCELVNKCQQDNFNIADALQEWLKLDFYYNDENHEMAFKSRLKKVIKPIGLAAKILHPIYRGSLFSENAGYNQMVSEFFQQNLDTEGLKDLTAYQETTGIFSVLRQKGIQSPATFWNFAKPQHPSLAELAKKLHRIPSSTAAIERLFSQWSFIHSKLRNRLGTEKSKKLAHIYYTLRNKNNKNGTVLDDDDY